VYSVSILNCVHRTIINIVSHTIYYSHREVLWKYLILYKNERWPSFIITRETVLSFSEQRVPEEEEKEKSKDEDLPEEDEQIVSDDEEMEEGREKEQEQEETEKSDSADA
jgi:hypothetical protein